MNSLNPRPGAHDEDGRDSDEACVADRIGRSIRTMARICCRLVDRLSQCSMRGNSVDCATR